MRDYGTSFEEMTTAELGRMRTDLNISVALAAPGSPVRATAERELHLIATVLASAIQH